MKPPGGLLALLFADAALGLIGTVTSSWVTFNDDGYTGKLGLRGFEACDRDSDCESTSMFKLIDRAHRGKDVVMGLSGIATFTFGLVASILTTILGGLAAAKSPKSGLGVVGLIFIALAGISAGVHRGDGETAASLVWLLAVRSFPVME